MQSLEINPPNNVRVSFTTNKNLPPTLILSDGFAPNALSLANASNVELVAYDRKGITPSDYQWNFNVQRQLPGGILLEVGYYGNKLDHMWGLAPSDLEAMYAAIRATLMRSRAFLLIEKEAKAA